MIWLLWSGPYFGITWAMYPHEIGEKKGKKGEKLAKITHICQILWDNINHSINQIHMLI